MRFGSFLQHRWFIAVLLLASIAGGVFYRLVVPGASFLLRMRSADEAVARAGHPFHIVKSVVELPKRRIPIRMYLPREGYHSVLLVIHGVHREGYDEVRLVRFARILAGLGHAVVTPEIAHLKHYDINPMAVEDIKQAALWALNDSGLTGAADDHRIGILGISFSGGLGLSAAASLELRDRVRFVFSFGGHADLKRTMTYLVTGDLPGGSKLPPHVYGQAVIALRFVDQLVSPDDEIELREALFDYLREDHAGIKAQLDQLGPSAKRIIEQCLERNTEALGALLEPFVRNYHPPAILSPVQGEPPSCPVFLLHGSVDNVIPPSETAALHEWASKATDATVVISDLIRHVELGQDQTTTHAIVSYWQIIRFWTELLRS